MKIPKRQSATDKAQEQVDAKKARNDKELENNQ